MPLLPHESLSSIFFILQFYVHSFRLGINVSNTKIVGFIPIDVDGQEGLLSFGNSYGDFVFFDENDFCVVEFKLNVMGTEERSRHKNRTKGSIHYWKIHRC